MQCSMRAGKAARMKMIVVSDELHFDDPRFSLANGKLGARILTRIRGNNYFK